MFTEKLPDLVVQEILTNRCAPSDAERVLLEEALPAQEKSLQELEAAFQELQMQRDLAHREDKGIRGSLSLIRLIPNELLGRIWIHYIDDYNYNEPKHALDNLPPQLVIAQICSKWRAIIFEDGRFWLMIDISSKRPHLARCMDLFNFWLERSSLYSFSLRFGSSKYGSHVIQHQLFGKFVEILSPHIHRIKTLELTYKEIWSDIFPSPNTNFAALEQVSYDDGYPVLNTSRFPLIPFLNAPKLERLELKDLTTNFFSGSLTSQFPYHQLTSISISSPASSNPPEFYPLQVLGIILHCRELRSCSLSLRTFDIIWDGPRLRDNVFTFPNLNKLSIQDFHGSSHLSSFLSFIVAPKLESFYLKPCPHSQRRSVWDAEGMQCWKESCGFSLKSFAAYGMDFSVESFYAFCGNMATLEEIRVKITSGANVVLQSMQSIGTDGCYLWPELTCLVMRTDQPYVGEENDIGLLLGGLVESRWRLRDGTSGTQQRLKAIRVGPIKNATGGPLQQVENQMETYRNEGLVILLFRR